MQRVTTNPVSVNVTFGRVSVSSPTSLCDKCGSDEIEPVVDSVKMQVIHLGKLKWQCKKCGAVYWIRMC